MNFIKISLFVVFMFSNIFAIQHQILIDQPTAGMCNPKTFYINNEIYSPNGLTSYIGFTPYKRLSLGASIGVSNFFGSDTLTLNYSSQTVVGIQAKIRVVQEKLMFPAIVLGFDSQGKGAKFANSVADSLNISYPYPAIGPYVSISKAFELLDLFTTGVHGIVNFRYWDNKTPWNFGVGFNFDLINSISLISEYNFATYSKNNIGILNSGVRWQVTENFIIDFYFKDILGSNKDAKIESDRAGRGLRLSYIGAY